MTTFVGAGIRRPMWSVPHAFDPSYAGDGTTCVCGVSVGDDIHVASVAAAPGVSELAGRCRS